MTVAGTVADWDTPHATTCARLADRQNPPLPVEALKLTVSAHRAAASNPSRLTFWFQLWCHRRTGSRAGCVPIFDHKATPAMAVASQPTSTIISPPTAMTSRIATAVPDLSVSGQSRPHHD